MRCYWQPIANLMRQRAPPLITGHMNIPASTSTDAASSHSTKNYMRECARAPVHEAGAVAAQIPHRCTARDILHSPSLLAGMEVSAASACAPACCCRSVQTGFSTGGGYSRASVATAQQATWAHRCITLSECQRAMPPPCALSRRQSPSWLRLSSSKGRRIKELGAHNAKRPQQKKGGRYTGGRRKKGQGERDNSWNAADQAQT